MSHVAEFFDGFALPTMSEVAQCLVRTLNDSEAPVGVVRDAIAKDPALTVKLIRLANSARFGMSRQVGSLDDAITLIGTAHVRTLALSACLSTTFPVGPGLDRKAFWQGSMATAGYAGWLASGIGADAQTAWLTGFMVRLGELVMAQAIPGCLQHIEGEPRLPGSRWQRELDFLGFDEGQVTAELARRWQFPTDIVRGLDTCGTPMASQNFCQLGAIVHVAALLAEMAPQNPEDLDALPADVLDALQVDRLWMRSRLPLPETFTDTASLA